MKLKRVLTEVNNQNFLGYLENEFKIFRRPLYRGSDRKVDQFEVFSARTDRNPATTSQGSQAISVVLGDIFYPSHPNRAKSKFATLFEKTARSYGGSTYYFFPHKNSKISWYESDTFPDYFTYMNEKFEYIEREFEDFSAADIHGFVDKLGAEMKKFAKFLFGLWELKNGRKLFLKKSIKDFSSIKEIVNFIDSYLDDLSDLNQDIYIIFKNFKKILQIAQEYFEGAKRKYAPADEIVVEGRYMMLNIEWFKHEIGEKEVWGEDKYSKGPLTNQ